MEMGLWKGDPVLPYSKRHLTFGSPWVWRYRELLRNDSVLKRSSEEWSTPPRFEVWRRSVANLHVEHHKRWTMKDFCLGSSEGLAFSFSMTPIQPLYFYMLIYYSLRFFRLYFTDDIFNLPQKCKHSKGVLQTHCLEQLSDGKFSGKFSRSPV